MIASLRLIKNVLLHKWYVPCPTSTKLSVPKSSFGSTT